MKKRIDSFKYAFTGIAEAFKGQTNMRIHLLAAIVATCIGFLLHISVTEWCCIVLCCGFVITLELLNTAIEKLCDFAEPQRNEKIRIIKDISAAAVLVASITALIVGLLIFVPKLMLLFNK